MAIFTVMGCDDNKFLEEDPETFYTIDNVFTTSEQVDQVLTTCYIKVHNIYCPYNNFGELNLWSYGMGNGTDVLDVPTIRYSYRFNDYSIINSEYGVFKDTYAAFYYLINAANHRHLCHKFRAYNVEFGIRQSLYYCSGPILQSFCLQKFRRTIWRSSVGNRNNFYS